MSRAARGDHECGGDHSARESERGTRPLRCRAEVNADEGGNSEGHADEVRGEDQPAQARSLSRLHEGRKTVRERGEPACVADAACE
jgi:hypothetical protein